MTPSEAAALRRFEASDPEEALGSEPAYDNLVQLKDFRSERPETVVTPETFTGLPSLPQFRTAVDVDLDQTWYALVESAGRWQLLPGRISAVHDVDYPEGTIFGETEVIYVGKDQQAWPTAESHTFAVRRCPGFVTMHFDRPPYKMIGPDLDYNTLIPEEALPPLRDNPDYLKAWLDSGAPEGTRMAGTLLAELRQRLGPLPIADPESELLPEVAELEERLLGRTTLAELPVATDRPKPVPVPDPAPAPEPLPEPVRLPTPPEEPPDLVALEEEYLSRSWRDSLYAVSKVRERELLARGSGGRRRGIRRTAPRTPEHRGLVAMLVRQANVNGHTGELWRLADRRLAELIRDFQPRNGDRLADHICLELDTVLP